MSKTVDSGNAFADMEAAVKIIKEQVPELQWQVSYRFSPAAEYNLQNMLQSAHKQEPSMKHKITVVACLVAIVLLGGYAAKLHHNYEVKQQKVSNSAHTLQVKLSSEASQKEAQFQAGVKLDETQCSKDQAAYDSLTTLEREKTTAPDCEADLVQ